MHRGASTASRYSAHEAGMSQSVSVEVCIRVAQTHAAKLEYHTLDLSDAFWLFFSTNGTGY